ncbi:hypothetical protein ACQB60_23880 [Actinomycetota bacterium Odt1-20B]
MTDRSGQMAPGPRGARYHLRFQIRPSGHVAEDAAALAKACGAAGVDEVVLLLAAEEAHPGHLAGAAEDRWYDTVAEARDVLAAEGVGVSLNPWVTVGHADRGRRDPHGFAPMVSPTGQVAAAQASFACPRWREWLYAHYGRFAGLGLRVLWIEDDFRIHNHAPLDWGGGFEPLMLERLSALAGEPVTREAAARAFTAPGPPHPWRRLLQQVWRTAQLEVADTLSRVVADRSAGRSRLGLMSSRPDLSSAEGRDWPALFQALAAVDGHVVHRPHFAPYADAPGRGLTSGFWSLELQRTLRPPAATTEPEIENWPHTSWAKSDTQTWSELVTAQLHGADALLLNLYPTHGARPERYPEVESLLRRARPALDWTAARTDRSPQPLGVGLPFRQDAASRVRAPGPRIADLAVDPEPAADFLLGYGVPVTAEPAPVQALFGRLADAFDDDELLALLGGGLLLDGTAAAILAARGFADLLGVRVRGVVGREEDDRSGPYASEHVGEVPEGHLPDADAVLSVDVQPALARLDAAEGATVLTGVRTPDGRPWGVGRSAYVNRLGGRVVVLAGTEPRALARSDTGRRLVHAAIRFLEGEHPTLPLVSGGPHLIPRLTRNDGTHRLALANGSADPVRPRVAWPDTAPEAARATLLAPLAPPRDVPLTRDGNSLRPQGHVPYYGWVWVEW